MESKLGKHFEFEPFPCMKIGENGSIGYSIEHKVAVEFLGIGRETLRRVFQRRGIRPVSHDEMTPLSEFRREFYALGGEQDG